MGILILVLLLALETFFLVWSLKTRTPHREEKAIVRIGLLALFVVSVATGLLDWSFRFAALSAVLLIQAVSGIVVLVRKREATYRTRKTVTRFAGNSLAFVFALSLAIVCPPFEMPVPTGDYAIGTARHTWTDSTRVDPFATDGSNRSLTVEFWYPEQADEPCPLVVFSHGAFGFSGSNLSTFRELASHGFVVASIGHTYQAFFTRDTSGTMTFADAAFLQRASELNGTHETGNTEDTYRTTQEWMQLRTADAHFVLDTLLAQSLQTPTDSLFSRIDFDKIGMFGHSLGGATAAQLGRERTDIDAVIVLDGTMLGEEVDFKDGAVVLNEEPYPVPLLNVYAQDHYESSLAFDGEGYDNFHATRGAMEAYETVYLGAGHLNFTDLPLFSPLLAEKLGVGTTDARVCIETVNGIVVSFFDSILQDTGAPAIEKEYGK